MAVEKVGRESRGSRVPAGVAETLSPSEQAHMDSGGESAIDAPAPVETREPDAPEPAAPAVDEPAPAVDVPPAEPDTALAATDPKPATMVPHAALHEERERRKEAE